MGISWQMHTTETVSGYPKTIVGSGGIMEDEEVKFNVIFASWRFHAGLPNISATLRFRSKRSIQAVQISIQ